MGKRKYIFNNKIYKDKNKRKKVESIIRKEIKKGVNTHNIYLKLKNTPLGYNKSNTLKDIRRMESEYNIKLKKIKRTGEIKKKFYIPKTSESRKRKAEWYNDVFLTFMERNKLTPKQTKNMLKKQMAISLELISEITDDKKYWAIYREVFGL